jgi:hypothetical protein
MEQDAAPAITSLNSPRRMHRRHRQCGAMV